MYDRYDNDSRERFHSIYGDYGSSDYYETSPKQGSGTKRVLMVIGLLLAVILISIAACTAYLTAVGFFKSGNEDYKVNQVSSKVVSTSAGTVDAMSTPEVIQKVLPSVVGITAQSMAGGGSGSGIVFSKDGYIVTNQHVINNAQELKVTLSDGTEYEASLVGQDEKTDLAVLKIDAKDLTAAVIGDSDQISQGETVLVIGNPLGETLSGSTTQGIISAVGREIEIEGRLMHYLQTDAAINPGNSGGPLVNAAGMVVGVTSAKVSSSSTEGLGFAIPINEAIPVIEELINNGYVTGRPLIGISGENISAQVAQIYNLPLGVYVRYVDPESGAAKAGIAQGDIITAINGTDISTIAELNNLRDNYKAGETVTLSVFRNGKTVEVDIVLGEANNENN